MSSHNINLARTALDLYDQLGEAAMIAFLTENRDPVPQKPDEAHSWANRVFLLKDGSEVRLTSQTTYAVGTGADPQDTRPATLATPLNPSPPAEPVPMLTWPNSESLWFEIMQLAHDAAEQQLGLEPREKRWEDPLFPQTESFTIAPGMNEAILTTIQYYDLPDLLLSILDREIRINAQFATEEMPDGEFDLLVQATIKKLRERQK